jgi:hypothetical protein
MRSRLLKSFALFLLISASLSFAQTPGVAVTATLINGQGQTIKTAYLHFELWNCGLNVPQVIGAPLTVVTSQFDLHANPTTGLISGSVFGNNQILCGGVQSTEWLVTQYKAQEPSRVNLGTAPIPNLPSVSAKPSCRQSWCCRCMSP